MPYWEGYNELHQIATSFGDKLTFNYVIPKIYKEGVFIILYNLYVVFRD